MINVVLFCISLTQQHRSSVVFMILLLLAEQFYVAEDRLRDVCMKISNKPVILLLTVILCCLLYSYFFELWPPAPQFYTSANSFHSDGLNSTRKRYESTLNPSLRPQILIYVKKIPGLAFSLREQFNFTFDKCEWKCDLTFDQSKLPTSSAVVYEERQIDENSLPKRTISNKLFVFYAQESPVFPHVAGTLKRLPKHFFNRTMTYRKDSDFWAPYGKFTKSENRYSTQYVQDAVLNKTMGTVMIVSKCYTPGRREHFINHLKKFTNIEFYGRCSNMGQRACDGSCMKDTLKQARFYLSLENSICDEYVTEKVFRMKRLIVPIVARKKDHADCLPENSFIAIDEFKSAQDLASRLAYLSQNTTAYAEYFNWTNTYGFTEDNSKPDAFCKLCKELHKENPETKTYEDIWTWWGEGHCDLDHLPKLIRGSFFNQ